MNVWLAIGFIAQVFFASRFFIQWIVSEKKKKSVMPLYFWYSSIIGGMLLLSYAIHIKDPVFILRQSMGVFIYARNLVLIYAKKKDSAA